MVISSPNRLQNIYPNKININVKYNNINNELEFRKKLNTVE